MAEVGTWVAAKVRGGVTDSDDLGRAMSVGLRTAVLHVAPEAARAARSSSCATKKLSRVEKRRMP